jgi:hypothetical protein
MILLCLVRFTPPDVSLSSCGGEHLLDGGVSHRRCAYTALSAPFWVNQGVGTSSSLEVVVSTVVLL